MRQFGRFPEAETIFQAAYAASGRCRGEEQLFRGTRVEHIIAGMRGSDAPAKKAVGEMGERIGSVLKSKGLALSLFFFSAGLAMYGTFAGRPDAQTPPGPALEGWRSSLARLLGLADTFHSPLFIALLALLCLNVAWCTVHRLRQRAAVRSSGNRSPRRTIAWLDGAMHAAVLVILAGAAAKGWAGFIGTQIIPVGTASDTVFAWGSRRDVPVGFTIAVTEQQTDYYPYRARIGVGRAATGERLRLLELTEGRPQRVPGEDLEITVGALDRQAGVVGVSARAQGSGGELFLETKAGGRTTGTFENYTLTLVAFRQTVKTVRSRVAIREDGRGVADGWLEPNARLSHRGTSLFQTAYGVDKFGNPYAGIQVTRDPGAPLFWAGCVLFCLTLPAFLYLRHARRSA